MFQIAYKRKVFLRKAKWEPDVIVDIKLTIILLEVKKKNTVCDTESEFAIALEIERRW